MLQKCFNMSQLPSPNEGLVYSMGYSTSRLNDHRRFCQILETNLVRRYQFLIQVKQNSERKNLEQTIWISFVRVAIDDVKCIFQVCYLLKIILAATAAQVVTHQYVLAFKYASRMIQVWFNYDSSLLQVCFKFASRIIQVCCKQASRRLQESFKKALLWQQLNNLTWEV